MPRRKAGAYCPHRGSSPVPVFEPGEPVDEAGNPVRLTNSHSCGETIFRGWKDSRNGIMIHTLYFATRESATPIKYCPRCGNALDLDDVRALLPDEPDPKPEAE